MNEDIARLVERLEAWAPLVASGYEVPAASTAIHEAASTIRALDAKLREAVEVMRGLADRWEILCGVIKPLINDDAYVAARAFLATMEKTNG
jgi:hypothetical protein